MLWHYVLSMHLLCSLRLHSPAILYSLSWPPYVRLRPLDGVLRAAARMIGDVPKFGHIGQFMRDTLCWLPVRQRILYRVSMHYCLALYPWRCSGLCFGAFLSYLRPVRVGDRVARTLVVTDTTFLQATKQKRSFSAAGPF